MFVCFLQLWIVGTKLIWQPCTSKWGVKVAWCEHKLKPHTRVFYFSILNRKPFVTGVKVSFRELEWQIHRVKKLWYGNDFYFLKNLLGLVYCTGLTLHSASCNWPLCQSSPSFRKSPHRDDLNNILTPQGKKEVVGKVQDKRWQRKTKKERMNLSQQSRAVRWYPD